MGSSSRKWQWRHPSMEQFENLKTRRGFCLLLELFIYFQIFELYLVTQSFKGKSHNRETFFLPDPVYEFFPSRILDPIKEFKYFNPKKWFLSSRKYDQVVHPGSGSWLFTHPGFQIPDPRVKKALDPGSGSATLVGTVEDTQIHV